MGICPSALSSLKALGEAAFLSSAFDTRLRHMRGNEGFEEELLSCLCVSYRVEEKIEGVPM